MYKSFSMELAGRTLTVDIGRVCAQANGAALLKYGETTVLSTLPHRTSRETESISSRSALSTKRKCMQSENPWWI